MLSIAFGIFGFWILPNYLGEGLAKTGVILGIIVR